MDEDFRSIRAPASLKLLNRNGILTPEQVSTAMEIFTPDEGAVERARKHEAAYSEALPQGIGAITIDGEMVDAASIRIARNIY